MSILTSLARTTALIILSAAAPVAYAENGGLTMIRIPGKNYEIGKYEVTQDDWKAVMGTNPSKFTSCGSSCPVEKVSWNDIQIFLQKLNSKSGKQYRLPTDAEWELACYGNSKTEYCGSNELDAVGWHGNLGLPGDSIGDTTHPVGQKSANVNGLHDMSGNVWEWLSDCWEGDCTKHVVRGGSWNNFPYDMRAANRGKVGAVSRFSSIGFRLARTLQ